MAKGKRSMKGRSRSMKRRTHRKGTRKSRRMMRGGKLMGSPVTNTSMDAGSKLNLAQGNQYGAMHKDQHGGEANVGYTGVLPSDMRAAARVGQMGGMSRMGPMGPMGQMGQMGGMAPVGDTGMLEAGLREAARIQPLDASTTEIAGMRDQGGGGRRKTNMRKSRNNMRKSRTNMRKSRTNMRKSRNNMRKSMRGGMADVGSPSMLLPVDMERQAVSGMNPEMKLAENPNAFSPLKH